MKTRLNIRYITTIILLTSLFILVGMPMVSAQNIPPVIQAQITTELQRRGLNEQEVRTRLLKEGIDFQNIPKADWPQYQTKVIAILDKMQAEKKAAATSAKKAAVTPTIIKQAKPASVFAQPIVTPPVTTKGEAVAEAAQRVIQAAVKKEKGPAQIYGHALFTNKTLAVFRTTDGAHAPDSYILGAGDVIRVTIFGASQADMEFTINKKGYIQPTNMPKIFLQGLTLREARNLLRKRLSTAYTFQPDQFALTITTARTVMINIYGEVKISGGFTLSALNSAFNALTAAGGVTNIGSVRNIQLIRGNKRTTMDLYAFMNDPTIKDHFDLRENDIIYVPVAKKLVSVYGAVKRPMRYELLHNEGLKDLIRYAGGLKVNAYPNFVQIQRYVDGEVKLKEFNLSEVLSGKIKVKLQNGDIVRIKSIKQPLTQYVKITGSIYYPGQYALNKNSTLSKLLANAKPTTDAKTDLIFVDRTRPDETVKVLTIPWKQLQRSGKDFTLMPRDVIKVPSLVTYRDTRYISVDGYVRAPFTKLLASNDHLSIKQAIELAGGLKPSAFPVAYVFRKDLINPAKMQYIRVDLKNADNFMLQPGDRLNVYDNSSFTNVGEVQILGAVKKPLKFTFDPSLTVQGLITAAGGFNVGAAYNRIEVFRTKISHTEETRLNEITVEVDSNYKVISPANFNLQPYDLVVVRFIPGFTLGRTVEISGEINYPGAYALTSRQIHVSDLIKMAGGLRNDADARGSRLFRTYKNRGFITMDIAKAIENKGKTKFDPFLFSGDVINIDRRENIVSIRETATHLSNYPGVLNNGIMNLVFQGKKSARWYINNYAGGFKKRADKKSVVVILKNGQMKLTRRFMGIYSYPKAETGSMISLQMKPPKEKRVKPKEKTDWSKIWSTTLAAITTALTIFVLAKRL